MSSRTFSAYDALVGTTSLDDAPGYVEHLLAVLAVCLAASLPYMSTARRLFRERRLRRGAAPLKPPLYFPKWFVTSWMDDIRGATQDEVRPFPAVTYQLAAMWGAKSTVANHRDEHRVPRRQRAARAGHRTRRGGCEPRRRHIRALAFATLPLQAESVIWITGRVDTIPAVFFLGSFLAYACWRHGDAQSTRLYVCSIVLFFCALFGKQNTIVMVAALVMYDLVAERRPIRASWSWLAPYVPCVALTVAYLLLRYVLFGEVAREGQLTADELRLSRIFVGKPFQRMFFGGEVARWPGGYIAAILLTTVAWFLMRSSGAASLRHAPANGSRRAARGRRLRIDAARVSRRGGMGDHPRSDVSHPLARPPCSAPICHAPRECGPARLLFGQTAGGRRRLEGQGTNLTESRR